MISNVYKAGIKGKLKDEMTQRLECVDHDDEGDDDDKKEFVVASTAVPESRLLSTIV